MGKAVSAFLFIILCVCVWMGGGEGYKYRHMTNVPLATLTNDDDELMLNSFIPENHYSG